jgi:hypothetical protein
MFVLLLAVLYIWGFISWWATPDNTVSFIRESQNAFSLVKATDYLSSTVEQCPGAFNSHTYGQIPSPLKGPSGLILCSQDPVTGLYLGLYKFHPQSPIL